MAAGLKSEWRQLPCWCIFSPDPSFVLVRCIRADLVHLVPPHTRRHRFIETFDPHTNIQLHLAVLPKRNQSHLPDLPYGRMMLKLSFPAVILLSFVLAAGFLLVILSCALWANWLPLLVALTFVLAPIPNSICSRCARADDISSEFNSAYVDFGRFLTGMLVTTGLSLPLLLAHSALIQPAACWMSIAGGGLVYATILIYSGWFGGGEDDDF